MQVLLDACSVEGALAEAIGCLVHESAYSWAEDFGVVLVLRVLWELLKLLQLW